MNDAKVREMEKELKIAELYVQVKGLTLDCMKLEQENTELKKKLAEKS